VKRKIIKGMHCMKTIVNVTLVGVGGQGILLTSDILARVAAASGKSVRKSELHGMSQRGGSVMSQIRFSDDPLAVFGPVVPAGQTDVLVAFEKLEAIRNYGMLKKDTGMAIIDDRDLVPTTVSSGAQEGLQDSIAVIEKLFGDRFKLLGATAIALELGSPRFANMVLAGALSKMMPFEIEVWHAAMRECIKPGFIDVNLKAFDIGRG
jgi:indolepyruvate ferredoxin oxidoreductase beta subunit